MLPLLLLLLLLADKVEAMSGGSGGGGEDRVLVVAWSDVVWWAIAQQLALTKRGRSQGRECSTTYSLWWFTKAGALDEL